MKSDHNIILNKSYLFAIRIVNAYKYLTNVQKEYVLSKQLLRSGTSVGALVREGVHAQSRADFLNKMNIALKEANETSYWLSLLMDTGYLEQQVYDSISMDCSELIALLVSIVKTLKQSLGK